MHSLLKRQLRRYLGEQTQPPEALQHLLDAVSDAYHQADADRAMVERSLELMSQELTERNRQLQQQLRQEQQTEDALRESRTRLARAQQVAHLGSWELDVAHDRMEWSDQLFQIFGVSPEHLDPTRSTFIERVHPEDRELLAGHLHAAQYDAKPFAVDHRIVLPGGAIRHVHQLAEVECGEDAKVRIIFGTVHDITARKQIEHALTREKAEQAVLIKRLEETHHQLLQSEKMASIGQLAAGVAHEINNPIGYINSNLSTLRDYATQLLSLVRLFQEAGDELDDELPLARRLKAAHADTDLDFIAGDLLDLLQESQEGIARVRGIVQDLKDFSHADKGEWTHADLHRGLDTTLNVVNNEIKYKATVCKEYGELPLIHCLPSQLNQVFMNLLVNAAQAIEGQGRITVRTGRQGEHVWVEVCDTGAGIPANRLGRIFDPFYTTKPVGKGTGLGLSISYGIVRKHHGDISVDSEPGKGTTFRITLPIEQDEATLQAE